jgi:hypothetical protein
MKKIYGFLIMLLAILTFRSNLNAQCTGVTVEAFPLDPQSGPNNYFGVRVTLAQIYTQNVTVNGYIYDEGNPHTNNPFEVTVISGYLTGETSATFYQTCATCNVVLDVISVSPCPADEIYAYWQTQLDSIGIIHNMAMEYAFRQLQQENPENPTLQEILELSATYISTFYANRYGGMFNFSQNDLYSELIEMDFPPPSHTSLSISNKLKETIDSILSVLSDEEMESYQDFRNLVNNIVDEVYDDLSEIEKTYLKAFKNVIIESFGYWIENLDIWEELLNENSAASNSKDYDLISEKLSGPQKSEIHDFKNKIKSSHLKTYKKHRCTGTVVQADVQAVVGGAVAGCIGGIIFGVVVGCVVGAIFYSSALGSAISLAAAIACLAGYN